MRITISKNKFENGRKRCLRIDGIPDIFVKKKRILISFITPALLLRQHNLR